MMLFEAQQVLSVHDNHVVGVSGFGSPAISELTVFDTQTPCICA